MDDAPADAPAGVPACARCGRRADGPALPLTWSTAQERGRSVVFCDRCSRENVRGVESKLDSEWW